MWQYWVEAFNSLLCILDSQPPGLEVQTVTAVHPKGTTAWQPGLLVQLLCGHVVQGDRYNTYNAIGNAQQLTKLLGNVDRLVQHLPALAILRERD